MEVWVGLRPLEGTRGLSWLLVGPWLVAPELPSRSTCVSKFPPLLRAPVVWIRAGARATPPHSIAKTLFPNEATSEALGVRASACEFWGGCSLPHNLWKHHQ